MHWQFHYPKRLSFYPPDFEDPGLGGSEAALVLLTRALASRGHTVEVFNCCWKPGVYDGVSWRPTCELPTSCAPDVAVAVRFEEAIWSSHARRNMFWMLDDRPAGANAFFTRYGEAGTIVVSSSAQHLRLRDLDPRAHVTRSPLPVEVSRFNPHHEREKACLFCSMPNRGLDVALRIWPEIKRRIPGASLWVTGGWELWGYCRAEAEDRWQEILEKSPISDGVTIFRALPRPRLIELQQKATLALYPCRFPEMFCLSAAECSAAGTPMVTSAMEALTERVKDGETGILVPGPIDSPAVQEQFVAHAVTLLTDPSTWQKYSSRSREIALHYEAEGVAQNWEALAQCPHS